MGDPGLWSDEAATWLLARSSPRELLAYLRADVHPPLYYMVQAVWIRLAGASEASLRLVSALAGAGTVFVLPWSVDRVRAAAGGESGPGAAGLWAAALLAVSPMHLHYSQEAKSYALLLLLEVAAAGVFAASLAAESRSVRLRTAALWLLAAVAAVQVHATAVFFLVGVAALPLIFGGRTWSRDWRWSLLALAPGVSLLPWSGRAAWSSEHLSTALGWMDRHFAEHFPWQIVDSLLAFSPGTAPPLRNLQQAWSPFEGLDAGAWSSPWVLMGAALLAGLLAAALTCGTRRAGAAALLLLGLLPLVALFAASAWRIVYLVGRTDVMALPWILAACAVGVERWEGDRAWRALVPAGLWFLLAAPPVAFHYTTDVRSWEREVFSAMVPARPGDVVVVTGERLPAALYYLDGPGTPDDELGPRVRPFPAELAGHPAWETVSAYDAGALAREAGEAASSLAGNRVFVLWRDALPDRLLVEALTATHGDPVSVPGTPLGTILVFAPAQPEN